MENGTPTFPQLLSFTDTCARLGFSRAKGERLIRGGDFPRPFKIGAERFYRIEDVAAWIASKADEANQANAA
jgi:predicted DNA-binding transcriptional regulator AlpA